MLKPDKLLSEDSDIKIAGEKFTKRLDDGELAAEEFQHQKSNGNIDKAYTLGTRLSELLFTTDIILSAHCGKKYATEPVIKFNAQVLFAFMAATVLEHSCPDSIIAQTAINHFFNKVKEQSPELYHAILENGAFSLYLLCVRDEKMACSCIGNTFAESCEMDDNPDIVKLGDELYNDYFELCRNELISTNFVK